MASGSAAFKARRIPAASPRVAVRYEVAPDDEAQVHVGVIPLLDDSGRKRSVVAFVMVLSFSRALSVAFLPQQDLSTLLRRHLQAFERLGGCRAGSLYDTMKAVVAGRDGERWYRRLLQRRSCCDRSVSGRSPGAASETLWSVGHG